MLTHYYHITLLQPPIPVLRLWDSDDDDDDDDDFDESDPYASGDYEIIEDLDPDDFDHESEDGMTFVDPIDPDDRRTFNE